MRRTLAALIAVISAAIVAAPGQPPFMHGSKPVGVDGGPPPSGGTEVCDGGAAYPDYTKVCAKFKDGQAFVTFPDSGVSTNRFRMYRSTSPIDSGNYTSATLIASYIFNNSGQLYGGDPANTAAGPYTQAYRTSCTRPMAVLSDLGTPLPCPLGLQVYTALTSGDAYYAIVQTTTTDTSPVFVGSVGPVAETVAPPQAIKYADSLNRGQNYGKIIQCKAPNPPCPLVYRSHASDSSGGCLKAECIWGDYNEMWLPADSGWQDGRPVTFSVMEDNGGHNPSFTRNFEYADIDTITDPGGTIGMETYHIGIGMTPNPLVGSANRQYLTGRKQIEHTLSWALAHYNIDPNALHWKGHSMGAWGGASTGIRMNSPRWASVWTEFPIWRHDRRLCSAWPGSTWSASMPFKATLAPGGSPSATLGCTASSVLMSDGSTWGGDGGYADIPAYMASDPGADLPFVGWWTGKYDSIGLASFLEHIEATEALQSAHRGHAFVWSTLDHLLTSGGGIIDCDGTSPFRDTTVCYDKELFRLNLPYIAFANSSIDDDPGTGARVTNGLYDGDPQGCINCGFKWSVTTDTASALNFTVSNVWMTRSPTTIPTTTITGTIASTGSGSVSAVSTSGWLATGANPYALVGDPGDPATQEVIKMTSTAGNTITFSTRGMFGTTAKAHASGQTITQFVTQPTGPGGGPYTTMTADVTPRRLQGFVKPAGTVVNCTVTPFGDAAIDKSGTVVGTGGVFTLTDVPINATGVTSIACS